jgi:hypothetical protein
MQDAANHDTFGLIAVEDYVLAFFHSTQASANVAVQSA